jgi:hypothetical protein
LQDGELVAAEARHGIMLAQLTPQAAGDLLEQQIAQRMAERVVDGFEIIEIDAQYGELPAVAARKHRLQTLVQQHAIGQRGERIVMRHVGDARRVYYQ